MGSIERNGLVCQAIPNLHTQSLNCPNLPLIRKVWLFQGGHDKVIFIRLGPNNCEDFVMTEKIKIDELPVTAEFLKEKR